jgi:HprK-related kinase A
MRLLKHLPTDEFRERLAGGNLALHIGPYIFNLQSNLPAVAEGLATLYADFRIADQHDFIDFNVGLLRKGLLQRIKKQAAFVFDHVNPFDAVPVEQAYAFLEWGLNWCVSVHSNEYLKLHAGVVSTDDVAVIMPGVPGAGKSTLCAALGLRGWRILSDEHAMLPLNTTQVVPLCRPVSLKNESIEVIKSFSSNAIFGPVSKETHKGVVVHMKADLHQDSHDPRSLPAIAMVFPRFSQDEPQQLTPRRRTDSFILAAYHSFNYSLLCEAGFEAMKTLLDEVDCYDLVYRDLEWAVNAMDELHRFLVAQ